MLDDRASKSGEHAAPPPQAVESPDDLPSPATALGEPIAIRVRYRRPILTLAAALVGAAGLYVWRDVKTALVFLGCSAAAYFLVPGVARWARRRGAIALPGGRAVHEAPTPLVGGAALFIPVAGTLLVLGMLGDAKAWGLLVGGTLVFACGLKDDLNGSSPRLKILAQLAAGGVLLLTGFRLEAFGIPGVGVLEVTSGLVQVAAVLFWVVLATNALNLSDGIDGLATSLAVLGLGVLAAAGVPSLVPVALAGACLGFLYFNLPRARIFLGDAGSLLLGFLLAALVLELPVQSNVPMAVAAIAYSLGDVSLAVFRRFVRGKPLFAPDRSHVHHKALQYLGTPLRALLAAMFFATLQAALLVIWPGLTTLVVCGVMWFVLGAALARLGNYGPARVLANRRPMRRLHLAQGYVAASLDLAEDRSDVEQALQHLIEAAGICSLALDDLELKPREELLSSADCCEQGANHERRCRDHVVALGGRFCAWSATPAELGSAMEQERETILTALLRQADECMQQFRNGQRAQSSLGSREGTRADEEPLVSQANAP